MRISSENKKVILRLGLSILVIGIAIVAFFIVFRALGVNSLTKEQFQTYIESTGAIAPIIFIGVSFLQVTFVPIPGAITILAGSYLFGFWKSFFYSYIGMMLGALFAFWLGRIIGRPYVNWVAGGKEKADDWIKKLKGRENVFLFFAFLLPFFPDDILCSIAGVLPIRWFTFIIMQLITRATSIGATLVFMSGEIIPFHGWGLVVLGAVGVIAISAFVISLKYATQLNNFFSKFIDKVLGKKTQKKMEESERP